MIYEKLCFGPYRLLLWFCLLALASCATESQPSQPAAEAAASFLFVGTYTKREAHVDGKAAGIYTLGAANLEQLSVASDITNPSYLAVQRSPALLYAVSETGPAEDSTAWVYAYRIDQEDGSLQLINRQPSPGFAPCYISLHPSGEALLLANYVGGAVAVYPQREDGSLAPASDTAVFRGSGPHPEQAASHPHCILASPDGRFVLVADKGTDRIMAFAWNAAEKQLQAADPPFTKVEKGAGPRHLAFHPNGQYLYLINELNSSVDAFRYSAQSGRLQHLGNYPTLPEGYDGGNSAADLRLSPDGRFLYASNRGHNSIALYQIASDGKLQSIGFEPTRGVFPRNFLITEDGDALLAANQNSDNIVRFRRDSTTGKLSFKQATRCLTPVCLKTF